MLRSKLQSTENVMVFMCYVITEQTIENVYETFQIKCCSHHTIERIKRTCLIT